MEARWTRERRAIRHLEVQMGHDRIAGISYQADHLTEVNFVTARTLMLPGCMWA